MKSLIQPQRILIIRPSALGDVCRTVPVLASLRKAWPDATIDWVVQEEFAPAVVAHPALSEVVHFPRSRFAHWWRSPQRAREMWRWFRSIRERHYDLVFDCQGLSRSGLIAWASGAKHRVGLRSAREFAWLAYNHRVASSGPRTLHTVDEMLLLLEAMGVEPVRDMSLFVEPGHGQWWRERRQALGLTSRGYSVFAPTSRWPSKRWPIERFSQLIEPLRMRGFERMVVIGSPSETEQVRELINSPQARHAVVDLVGQTSIGQTMAVIEDAGLVIANDSAPLHMAVGFERPCVALFGPTDPATVGPYRMEQSVVRGYRPARDETINFKDPKLGDSLMRLISHVAVLQTVDRVLAEARRRMVNSGGVMQGADVRTFKSARGDSPKVERPLWLASASPRRRKMLAEAGISVQVMPSDIDDGRLRPGQVTAEQWVMALAYLKARRVADRIRGESDRFAIWFEPNTSAQPGTVIGADTVCVAGDMIFGQPTDADRARSMLQSLRHAEHRTVTGVCLLSLQTARGARLMFCDRTTVRVGRISDAQIDSYVSSGDWRGKAGAYNLEERLAAGWPIEIIGDATTVMGLPMRRLITMLGRE